MECMKTRSIMALATLLTGIVVAAPASAATSFDVAVSNGQFAPAKIVTKVGEPTTLRLTSTEGVHGVASSDLGIPSTTLLPKKTVSVTFTPKKAGTYKVPCSVVCGAGHANMILTVEVDP